MTTPAGHGLSRTIPFLALSLLAVCQFAGAQDVLTGGYGNDRTNADLAENTLTPATVRTGLFGKLFTVSVDGQIYAQPLYQRNVSIAGKGTHNIVFVVTMHNGVYAFDSDTPGTPLWNVNLGPAVDSSAYAADDGDYSDILPENGILSTPVIDPATNTMYVVAATVDKGSYLYRLHALDTSTGAERSGSPALISGRVPGIGDSSRNGVVSFLGEQHIQRPALLLAGGVVYVAFGSHGDAAPYHGWIMAYDAANVQTQTGVFNASPNGAGGALWQSGRGLTADADGQVFAVTSNGDTDETSAFSSNVLRLDGHSLQVKDWFAPSDFQLLNDTDDDLGTCGVVLIPGTNLLLTGGKDGMVYVLDKRSLGYTNSSDGQVVQAFQAGDFGVFNMALWARPDGARLYLHTANSRVTLWQMNGDKFGTTPAAQSMTGFQVPYQGMTLSASGVQPGTGILWILAAGGYPLPAPGILRAYDAENLNEIWNSGMTPSDALGSYVKFVNPTVADGKVFVPSLNNQLVVYGPMANANAVPAVTAIVNAASYVAGPVAPGEILALFGQNLGPQSVVTGTFDGFGSMSRNVFGFEATFDNIPAPVLYTSKDAAAIIVPYELAGATSATLQVTVNGTPSAPQTIPITPAAPGLFSADASGRGPGAILNDDYTLNSPAQPATAGGIAVVYGTGGGVTTTGGDTGKVTGSAQPLAAEISVTVGGEPAQVLYAGNAGGEIAGAVQLNLRLPEGVHGDVPVVLTINGRRSQDTVTISIR